MKARPRDSTTSQPQGNARLRSEISMGPSGSRVCANTKTSNAWPATNAPDAKTNAARRKGHLRPGHFSSNLGSSWRQKAPEASTNTVSWPAFKNNMYGGNANSTAAISVSQCCRGTCLT